MESSDLFSHPQKPEFVAEDRDTTGAVTNPVFSDQPEPGKLISARRSCAPPRAAPADR